MLAVVDVVVGTLCGLYAIVRPTKARFRRQADWLESRAIGAKAEGNWCEDAGEIAKATRCLHRADALFARSSAWRKEARFLPPPRKW